MALLPRDIAPIQFRWTDTQPRKGWLVRVDFTDGSEPIRQICGETKWLPDEKRWEQIKSRSMKGPATVQVLGFEGGAVSAGRVHIATSSDPVAAPIFYREVNLPFQDAVKDPRLIRWRFGSVASRNQPPIVLEKMPVCGNCHSFSADGSVLGMDVDYANNKASYVITRTARTMTLATSDLITWSDYNRRDNQPTFGLLSQVSPDGRYSISTVKDRSVFVPQDDLAYSQLFFPIKGILAVYDRQTKEYAALSGADDPEFVQSNPTWSPDGKWIVFARARAYELKSDQGKILLTQEECREFVRDRKEFRFDLYRIPFNDGKGGTPEPIEGASADGMSNYFARFSPDGKWIVFCKANSYMLLQPDSELYILPAAGGTPRKLECNGPAMNSWHSFSPNGKWLVYSSKTDSPYTKLMLTHIDENGQSSVPIVLDWFTSNDRAANIPEFVNLAPDAIASIREQFLNDYSFQRAGNEFYRQGDTDRAIEMYEKTLSLNPNNAGAHRSLGFLLYNVKAQPAAGMEHLREAVWLDPADGCNQYDLGYALLHQKRAPEAVTHLKEAVRLLPNGLNIQYNAPDMYYNLGLAYTQTSNWSDAAGAMMQAAQSAPQNAKIRYHLAITLANLGKIKEPVEQYQKAIALQPDIDRAPGFHDQMAANYAAAGQFEQAIKSAERAVKMAQASGKLAMAQDIAGRLRMYQQHQSTVVHEE